MHTPIWFLEPASWTFWIVFTVIIAYIIGKRTRGLIHYANEETDLKLIPHFAWLATASIGTAFLAAVGTVFASFVGENGPLIHADTFIPKLGSVYLAFALIVLPIIAIMVPIALAVPAAPPRAAKGEDKVEDKVAAGSSVPA